MKATMSKSLALRGGLCLVCMILTGKSLVLAQSISSHDGLSLKTSSTNSNTFYYGEPIVIYFQVVNSTSEIKSYHKPQTGANLNYELKNITTGKILPRSKESSARHEIRTAMKSKPVKNPYKPDEYGFYSILMNEQFGSVLLSNSKIAGRNQLVHKLLALPVGEYEITLQYDLLPGEKSLTVRWGFKVLPLDSQKEQELAEYVQSIVYAAKSHFYTGKNYSSQHTESFENFMKKNPSSIYSDHAFISMVTDVYHYAAAGPSDAERFQKFREYVNYYPQLRNNTLKMEFVNYLPTAIKNIPNKDLKKELDVFLQNIKGDNPEISKMLIRSALFNHNVQGLTNYAPADNR